MTLPEYPNCRDDHVSIVGRVNQATKVRSCLLRLAQYDREILQVFASRMRIYLTVLRSAWNQVNRGQYSFQQKSDFYARISIEYANSRENGTYMDNYRLIRGRYFADKDYLRTVFCNLVVCPRRRR